MTDIASPYVGLPARAFWRSGVAEALHPPPDLFRPRWPLTREDRIVTAGSCFAQHVGRALRAAGFRVVDTEPVAEDPRDLAEGAAAHGYGLYSARYGNIYTVRQLRQLLAEAQGTHRPADPVWDKDGRHYDALRPNVEPQGFATAAKVRAARAHHLERVKAAFAQADVFVFTLGLTEAWVHRASGQVYPVVPGVLAGRFDPDLHVLANFRAAEIADDFRAVLATLRAINPDLRVLLTVSPVPLTATAGGHHVLAATTYSKSVLRAVAGELYEDDPGIDYFPSYEIVTAGKSAGQFFEANMRSVSDAGVARVMRTFLDSYGATAPVQSTPVETEAERQARKAARKAKRAARDGA